MLPASADNIGLFDATIFGAMKATAYYISAGRGQTVDEAALLAVLRERPHRRRCAGSVPDRAATHRQPFWDLPNVFITPHIGGYVIEYEDFIMPLIVDNMRLFFGRPTRRDAEYCRALVQKYGSRAALMRLPRRRGEGGVRGSGLTDRVGSPSPIPLPAGGEGGDRVPAAPCPHA